MYVGLLQPASTLLYNGTSAAGAFRTKLFDVFSREIINFAALRYVLFATPSFLACAVSCEMASVTGAILVHLPEPLRSREDRYRIMSSRRTFHRVFRTK
jgi:hypothetical protein